MKIEYLGFAALFLDKYFEKELVILGLKQIREGLTYKHTKIAIEKILSNLKLKKSKI